MVDLLKLLLIDNWQATIPMIISIISLLGTAFSINQSRKALNANHIPLLEIRLRQYPTMVEHNKDKSTKIDYSVYNHSSTVKALDAQMRVELQIGRFLPKKYEFIKSQLGTVDINNGQIVHNTYRHRDATKPPEYQYLENFLSSGKSSFLAEDKVNGRYLITGAEKIKKPFLDAIVNVDSGLVGYRVANPRRLILQVELSYLPSIHGISKQKIQEKYEFIPATDDNALLLGWDIVKLRTKSLDKTYRV